jgi:hypothetical protein
MLILSSRAEESPLSGIFKQFAGQKNIYVFQ